MKNGKTVRATRRVPKLCKHRSRSGQVRGYVTDPRIGREIYLGIYDSPECGDAYAAWRREYLSGTLPPVSAISAAPARRTSARFVADLLALYLVESRRLYRCADGTQSSEGKHYEKLIRRMDSMGFGLLPLERFGRTELIAIRDQMIADKVTRHYIVGTLARVVRIFKFAESRDLVPIDQVVRLSTLPPMRLTEGKSEREVSGVRPSQIVRLYRHLAPHWQAMMAFHSYTGCRAENAITIRLDEIDMTRTPWIYTPSQSKSTWRGKKLSIRIGPRARDAISPHLVDVDSTGYLFPCKRTSTKRRHHGGYYKALVAACTSMGVSVIVPRQIRHTTASELLRRGVPIHLIGAILGHSSRAVGITGRYASPDERQVCDVVERFG